MGDLIRDTSRLNVLVVDDDKAVRELLADGLEAFGYPSVMANGMEQAFEIVRREPLRLVLSDIDMPGGDGFELLDRIQGYAPDLDVIMVTGAIDADTAVQAIRRGASDYVTKPFNLDEVQIIVERTLDKRRLILENRAHQERLEELVEQRTAELVEKNREVKKLYTELEGTYEATLQDRMDAARPLRGRRAKLRCTSIFQCRRVRAIGNHWSVNTESNAARESCLRSRDRPQTGRVDIRH